MLLTEFTKHCTVGQGKTRLIHHWKIGHSSELFEHANELP